MSDPRHKISKGGNMTRNRASAKKAGTSFETLVAAYLAERLQLPIERRAKTGAKDRGDIAGVWNAHGNIVVECKNTSRDSLPQWIREAEVERVNDNAVTGRTIAGVVIHKKRGSMKPAEQYVSMDLDTFIRLVFP
jgi:hypothetical protein